MSTLPPPPPPGTSPEPQEPTTEQPIQPEAPQHQAPQQQAPQYQTAPGYPPAPGYAAPQYGAPQYGYPPARPNNQMALVSLIAGIAGWTILPFVGSIVAVVTGHMAKRQIRETGEPGEGMATAGLALGYIMIGIGLLIALAFLFFWGAIMASMTTTGSFT